MGALRLKFKASNNEAVNEALLAEVRAARAIGVHNIKIYSALQLAVNQVNGEYEVREMGMTRYLEKARNNLNFFQRYEFLKILREENT